MAAPAYVNFGTRSSVSSGNPGNSVTPLLPNSRSNGYLLIAIACSQNNETHNWTGTGWTKLEQVNSGAGFTVSLAYCIVNGSEENPTCAWTNNANGTAIIWQFSGYVGGSPFLGAHSYNAGSGSTHSITGITTTANNSRVIYIDGVGNNAGSAEPSGWTEDMDSGGGGCRTIVGGKDIASVDTASGNISVTGVNNVWVMWLIELRSENPIAPEGGAPVFARAAMWGRF